MLTSVELAERKELGSNGLHPEISVRLLFALGQRPRHEGPKRFQEQQHKWTERSVLDGGDPQPLAHAGITRRGTSAARTCGFRHHLRLRNLG